MPVPGWIDHNHKSTTGDDGDDAFPVPPRNWDDEKALKKWQKRLTKWFERLEKRAERMFKRAQKKGLIPGWADMDPETPWNIERIFDGNYVGDQIDSSSVQVAVLDSGVDLDHPELKDKIAWTYDATGQGIVEDDTGHGTHVIGIIAAASDDVGVVGVSPNVEIYSIKVTNGSEMRGEWEWLADGIYAAVRGPDGIVGTADDADVISMSLDSRGEVPPNFVYTAIKYAYDLGVVLVAAAGNDGDSDPSTLEAPTWPAAYPEVIAVSATTFTDEIANFSNTANYVEVAAPGDMILSTFLDGYAVWSGTSMATPHVSAMVALIIALYGKLPVGTFNDMGTNTIRGILHQWAVDLGPAGWDPAYGYGLVHFGGDGE